MFKKIIVVVFVALVSISYSEWTPDPLCPYPSDEVTNFQCYGNCSVYWSCYQGSKFLVECPSGLEFDVVTKNCTSPDVAQCDPYASTTTTMSSSTDSTDSSSSTSTTTISTTSTDSTSNTTPTGTGTTDPNDPNCPLNNQEITYVPYKGDCSKYWECYDGNAYLYTCTDGLWWNEATTQCDYPGDYCDYNATSTTPLSTQSTPTPTFVDSTTSRSTDKSTSSDGPTPNPDDITCPNPNDVPVFFPIPGDCQHYWECFEGNKILNTCSTGQWWHQETKECDQPGDYCTESFAMYSK